MFFGSAFVNEDKEVSMKMKWVVTIFFLCSFPLNNSFAETNLLYKFDRTYQSSAGPVTFTHGLHAGTYLKDCAFCHSALKAFGGKVTQLFAHNFCNNCHLQKVGTLMDDCTACHSETTEVSMK